MTQPIDPNNKPDTVSQKKAESEVVIVDSEKASEVEKGGPSGLEPTRYGDWERKGRCIDF